jgi:hypothetical protein
VSAWRAPDVRDKVFIHLQLCWAGSSLDEEQQSKEERKTENASSKQTLLGIYQSAPRIADGECLHEAEY